MTPRHILTTQLRNVMARHVWDYDTSSDAEIYKCGVINYRIMCDLFADLDVIDPAYAREVWNETAPDGWKFTNKNA